MGGFVADIPTVTPAELAGLMASFNEVTARLESTHDALRAEVARLSRELGEASAQVERSRRLAALGEMAAGIAHEVRNPLGSIRLHARMLEDDLVDRPGERGIAVKIGAGVRAVEGIVGDVLTFAREFKLRQTEFDAAPLFDEVLEACCHDGVSGWRGVEVVRDDRAVTAWADPALAKQALVNVVRNAFEAMAEAPGRAHRLTLHARRDAGFTILAVRDTGPGVTPDVVARMFNPFFTTRGTGTGLGLSIVHRIVDAHAGRVNVRNNQDGGRDTGQAPGACVEISFPLAAEQSAGVRPAEAP